MKDMDMLVELDSKESGKPYQNALNDFYSSYGVIGFYAEEAKRVFGTSVPDKGAADHAVYHIAVPNWRRSPPVLWPRKYPTLVRIAQTITVSMSMKACTSVFSSWWLKRWTMSW